MFDTRENHEDNGTTDWSLYSAQEQTLSRRSLLGAGALLGLAAITHPAERAFAWSSWTNATSPILKSTGMGDCVHEDLIQICYARMLRNHANDTETDSLLNPWAGTVQSDKRYATINGDTVDAGKGKTFANADDLAARLYRENLAYLRIGSFWNDSAANTLADFALSCAKANSVPKFSGNDYYSGAWDVGQHLWETNEKNKTYVIKGRDALVQFTMNDRNGFIHGMLSSTASHSGFLKQSDVKLYALQWLGVAYEYARTGAITATSDVTQEQAEKIFKGFIDTYGQLDNNAHGMSMSLKVGSSEASIKLPHRRLRLRALGMMCHTMEDLWCPAHTCRTYNSDGDIPQNSILAFCNYKLQNGNKLPLFGYHLPFDRYAVSDAKNSTNWREVLTRGNKGNYKGTEKLANVLDSGMSCLDDAHTYFKTLGMNETIACITKLLEYFYQGTAWDDGVRAWVDNDVMPTYFDEAGQSLVCDAGRRCLHAPTFLIAPIQSMKRAYSKVGLTSNYNEMLAAVKSYDAWQRGAHLFYSGKFNTSGSKYITSGNEGSSIWSDSVGQSRLVDLVDKIHKGYSSLNSSKRNTLLAKIGSNGCHNMVSALNMIGGMLQEFSVDLTGSLRSSDDASMKKIEEARSFFQSGLKGGSLKVASQAPPLLAASVAFADEGEENYMTSDMVIEDVVSYEDGSYLIAVRDIDSLETSIMAVPENATGKDKLEEGLANLTITYALQTEFEDDLDYIYVVADIDYTDMEENVYLVTGTVKSVSEGAKSIVIDLNGLDELELAIRNGTSDIPQVGAYMCARYTFGDSNAELIDYEELEAPDTLMKVTYPVAKVAGSNVWLLTNEIADDSQGGYLNYMQIYYGSADVCAMPLEGYYATVYYHDEAYGDVSGIDENALANATITAAESPSMFAQDEDDDINDSAEPGYLDFGDEYGDINYGNEVFHVANVIVGSTERADSWPAIPIDNGSPLPPSDEDTSPQPTPASSTPRKDDGKSSNPPVPKTGDGKPSPTTTPKTDDPLTGFGGLLSAAAVAGAAMAAYSARRVANERGGSKEEGA